MLLQNYSMFLPLGVQNTFSPYKSLDDLCIFIQFLLKFAFYSGLPWTLFNIKLSYTSNALSFLTLVSPIIINLLILLICHWFSLHHMEKLQEAGDFVLFTCVLRTAENTAWYVVGLLDLFGNSCIYTLHSGQHNTPKY